jgi:hypothetical protein
MLVMVWIINGMLVYEKKERGEGKDGQAVNDQPFFYSPSSQPCHPPLHFHLTLLILS